MDILNEDNDDSGLILRYTDINNYIRFHHTLDNAYNGGRTPSLSGCQGKGSFLVLRKAGKETCLKTSTWKYTQGKYHSFRVVSKTSTGTVQVYVDGSKLIDYTGSSIKNMAGSPGIWQAHSQIKMKAFKYTVQTPISPPPQTNVVTPAFGDMDKDGMTNTQSGSQDWFVRVFCLVQQS